MLDSVTPRSETSVPGRSVGHSGRRELGRGRSGVVFLDQDESGRRLACKVFDARGLTRLVQVVFLGSPNPYVWNEDAVRCAFLRRRILARLVELWFADRLRVAGAVGQAWNEEHRAFELRTEYSPGVPPPLHWSAGSSAGRGTGTDLVRELVAEILAPLQRHLIEAGFPGLVWQAGKGNPVALNNFLLERHSAGHRWTWIDLESGVPAIAPIDPRALLGFYLPQSVRFRRPLFDDVDTERLERYFAQEAEALRSLHGADELDELRSAARSLAECQGRWKTLRRHERGIGYALARGRLTPERAQWFRTRPLRWYAHAVARGSVSAIRLARAAPGWLARRLARVPWRAGARFAWSFATSGLYLKRFARHFVARRIRAWVLRGQLARAEAKHLRAHLSREESSAYLTDFAVHVALKVPVKGFEYWVLPALWALGWIGDGALALGLVVSGAAVRTLYTSVRCAQSLRHRRELPLVALGVGLLPMVGNFAYPVQILYSSTEEEYDLARFILYDDCARIGRHVPIWGGADTLTEHVFNRLPDRLVGLRRGRRASGATEIPRSGPGER
ncbi:MAG: hypothetical protein ACKVXR_01410 [Planctomycetota bacterium]